MSTVPCTSGSMTMFRPLISANVRSTDRRSTPWKSMLIGWPVYFLSCPDEICWLWPARLAAGGGTAADPGGTGTVGSCTGSGTAFCAACCTGPVARTSCPGASADGGDVGTDPLGCGTVRIAAVGSTRGTSGAPLAIACERLMVSAPSAANRLSSPDRVAAPAAFLGPWNTTETSWVPTVARCKA